MSDKNKKLYFVALTPPPEVFEKVKILKEEVSVKFESKAALRSPPHITLHMPFKYREDREDRLMEVLSEACKTLPPVRIIQKGFGAFAPRVIYVNVEKSDGLDQVRSDLVEVMRKQLKLENADYKNRPFHPHMTIAFRDLKKRLFGEAWDHYQHQEFSETWIAEEVALLKHTGKWWEIHRRIPFTGSTELLSS